ncbi:MAG: hypothetical protein FJ125_16825, partial [Deltaproteobacteria bacterium]|nr:hypothetical protein [Deltaproteobacteria bacterium]
MSKLAEDLAREQGLFDEDVRYRKVTRYSQVPRPGGTAAAAASGQGRQGQPRQPAATGDEAPANGAKTTGEGLPPAPPAQPPGALPADEAEDDGSWHNGASGQGEYGGDADNDPGADSFARDGDGVLDPAIAPALPEDVAQPGALDGFDDPARSFSPPPAFEARVGIKDDLDPDLGMRCEQ